MVDFPICRHVYEEVESDPCQFCGKPSHRMNWVEENKKMKEWKEANPDAEYEGWMSI